MSDPWTILGIAPTRDADAIRLAYAARLKATRPDVDPAGFRRLREAFDSARKGAAIPAPKTKSPDDYLSGEPTVRPEAGVAVVEIQQPPPREWPMRKHLAEGQLLEAARSWGSAVAANQISLAEQTKLQLEIATAAVGAPGLSLADLNEMIAAMQWEAASRDYGSAAAFVEIMRRRAAENWFAELRETAGRRTSPLQFAWRRRARGARILLRPAPGRLRRQFPQAFSKPDLGYWLAAEAHHRGFLSGRLDRDRVEWCRKTQRRGARFVVGFFRMWMWCALAMTLFPVGSSLWAAVWGVWFQP